MKYRSTRGSSEELTLSPAILRGLAPDGGLYVPNSFPRWDWRTFDPDASIATIANRMLAPFVADDPLASHLESVCNDTWNFDIPVRPLGTSVGLLELFHGPTAAFKDVGARFLAAAMSAVSTEATASGASGASGQSGMATASGAPGTDRSEPTRVSRAAAMRTILVATSGDTGGAIAAAFHRKPGIEVGILFPDQGVSPLQRQQLTCWGDNVRAFAVRGVFDDCQRLVKAAFGDEAWRRRRRLTSANSINIGRLLPQTVYYATSAIRHAARHGRAPWFVVPSGNVGNACAALWAQRMGFPIQRVVMATNRNRAVPDFLEQGRWEPRDSVATPANAMDVGNPSNMERVVDLLPTRELRNAVLEACWVSDEDLLENIRWADHAWNIAVCPHTAAAVATYRRRKPEHAILVATAHPAKFRETVEPVLGRRIDLPKVLQALMDRPASSEPLEPNLSALQRAMDAGTTC